MEIQLVGENCLRIKGKNSSLLVDPSMLKTKTPSDAVLLLKDCEFDSSKVEGSRILINGAGEYEFSGVKVSSLNHTYDLFVDGISLILGKSSELEKIKAETKGYDIAIIHVDQKFDPSILTNIEPKVAIFYGEENKLKADSGLDSSLKSVSKYVVKKESLPAELEKVLLASS
ncbi:MAG: hypothetical protein ABH816_03955 [Candidatus Levyibacteriota bacterium]